VTELAPQTAAAAPGTAWLGATLRDRIIFLVAVTFSLFQIWTAAYTPLSSLVVRSVHIGFLLFLAFALYPPRSGANAERTQWHGWVLAAIGLVLGLYQWVFEADLILRAGDPALADIIVGTAVVVLIFEAARRVLGLALPVICGLFLAYALFGYYLPDPLQIRPYGYAQVVDQIAMGTEGIYGIPILVSSTYIFLFILFGAFLEKSGMVGLFTDLAMGSVGHQRGGPAKVAVISSALMGTISGSGVANVVTTGQFTIPLMKRFGYRAEFAGAVEATASMGGQIMPPVMGAVAFIMAETIGVPYIEIVKAAIIPAILYFATALWMVHLEAGRLHLMGLPREQCPSVLRALRERWPLLLPLSILVVLLFGGYTPLFAGTVGLALTVVLILGTPLSQQLGAPALRAIFWIGLGLVCAGFFRFGIDIVLALVALLVLANLWRAGGRATLRLCLDSLADGARQAVPVGIACAIVGVIIGVNGLTGVATSFTDFVVSVGEHSLFLSLFLTMIACLVLGMGIPTIPNYIITSALVGPALLDLGVPLLVSHMFVFYFGIMADLTPPVALAAFAAAAIAKASPMRIGLHAVRIAVAGFVVPYMAVYAPALMLQSDDPVDVAYIVVKAVLAIGLWGAAAIGFFLQPLRVWERIFAAAAAFLLIAAVPVTDEIGFALCAAFFGLQWWRRRRPAAVSA
jgi:TRAP transporter 4TM/12TM fusion protein